MRTFLAAAALLAVGCAPSTQHVHNASCSHGSRDAILVGTAIGFGAWIISETMAAQPKSPRESYTPPPPRPPPFDREQARKALATVFYKDCGDGGEGQIIVTFSAHGGVTSVWIDEGDYTDNTAACLAGRFEGAVIPPFDGNFKRVRWRVKLPPRGTAM